MEFQKTFQPVTKYCIKDGERVVQCEIWTQNPQAKKTAPGAAILKLPSRAVK